MASGTATAVLYQMRKNVGALIAKMLAAVLFVIAGIMAFAVRVRGELGSSPRWAAIGFWR